MLSPDRGDRFKKMLSPHKSEVTGVPRIYSTFTDDGCNKIILSHVVGDRCDNIVFLHLSPPSYWQYIDNIVFLHLSPPFTGDRSNAWAFAPFAFWSKMANGGLATKKALALPRSPD